MNIIPGWVRNTRRPGSRRHGCRRDRDGDADPAELAYALLAGLPPEVGSASILPIIAYAALGSSMTLAVGPWQSLRS